MGARTRRSLALSWSALFVLSLLLQYFSFALAPAALAVHDEGLFELDGNTANDPAVTGDDWDSHPNATGNRSLFITDGLGAGDDIFTGGSSKDDLNTTGWLWKIGTVQDKNDIEHAYANSYEKNGHTFVYFGLDRFSNNGDAFTGFWFFKNGIHKTADGGFAPAHTVGDLLVQADFTNGGATSTINLYEWVGSGGDTNGTLDKLATGQVCTAAPLDDKACAVTNGAPIDPSWTFDDKGTGGSDNLIPTESFFEGGIDLDDLFGGNAPCFSSFLAETRSSQSVDATLSDFAGGAFNTCVPPTMATSASDDVLHFGDSVTDHATLSGTDGPASGSVRFFVCGPAGSAPDCSTGGTQVGSAVAVTTSANGGTATSAAFTPTTAGTYCFRAEYTPDQASQYLAASHTNQTSECFELVKNNTSITTAATQTVNVGQAISDSATLSGATSDAGGHITFRAYGPADANCSDAPAFTSASFPVSGNGTYGPASFTPATAGVYRWIASYSGDAKNEPSIGACNDAGENDTVNKVNPTIATVASAGITIGASISDTATVSGGLNPSGTVTFKLYGPNDATCANAPVFTSSNRPLSGGTATSASFTPTLVGTYRWIATYNGDANNNAVSGACNDANENVIVIKAHPSIATELVSGAESGTTISIDLGASVHDTSTLTGATATAGGTVHYQVFSDSSCDTLFTDAGTIPVVNGVPGNSMSITFNASGNYYWQADYSGDAANDAASSDCSLEVVSVGLNEPTISTNASDSVVLGGSIHDVATLAGGFNPTGSITFRLYGPNDATCATAALFTSIVGVNGNGDYTSGSFTPSAAGTYRWIATYSGDANNAAAAGACNDTDESVIVTVPNLHAVKLVATGSGAFGPTSQAQPGDVVNYQITVTNSGNADATNVPVTDDIADILDHASYNNDCSDSCVLDGTTLKWTIPSIAKGGGSEVLTFSVTLDADFPTGVTHLPNVVVVTGPGSNCAAGSEDADCDTDTTVSTSVLTIDKSVTGNSNGTLNGIAQAKVGDVLTYHLTYQGAGPITNAVITDPVPAELAYVAGSAVGDTYFTSVSYNAATRTLTWTAATLPDPASGEVTFKVTVLEAAAEAPNATVTNVATIQSDQTPIDDGSVPIQAVAPPLELTPPPTDTLTPQTATSNPGFSLMLLLLGIAGLTLGIGFITPAPARVRRRDRRG